MRSTQGRSKLATGLVLLAVVGSVAATTVVPAAADTTPPWEASSPNILGTLSFYDSASGDTPVTGGDDLSHIADYVLASTTDPSTVPGTMAQLEFANPQNGVPVASYHTTLDEETAFPNADAPGALGTSPNPLVSLDSTGGDLGDAVGGFDTTNPVAGFPNTYQIRVFTAGPDASGSHSTKYWDADVQIDPQAGTWVEVYPVSGAAPTATATVLSAAPTSPSSQGQSVTFTATETATDSTHPAGSVQFFDGNQSLGSPVAVDGNGVATETDTSLLPGNHTIKADFTTTASGYSNAPEATLAYRVNPVAAKPTISGTVQAGKTVTCKETSTSGETVTYAWSASGKAVGSGATLTVPGSAVGKSLTCTATVKITGGTPSSATSAGKTVAKGAALKASKKPALSGPGKVGKTEKVNPGKWSPAAGSYSYQWLLNGKAIKHATGPSYKLLKKDKGKKISCTVTASKPGFASGKATSAAVKVKS